MKRSRVVAILILIAVATGATYVAVAARTSAAGYPLDDSWIHQTFARNLAAGQGFSYNPGEQVAGSTSPLWTVILSVGYLLPIGPKLWTYCMGVLCIVFVSAMVYVLYLRLWPGRSRLALVAAVFAALEWRVGWASMSGMETALFMALSLLVLVLAIGELSDIASRKGVRAAGLGLASAALVLVRPEGVLLAGLSFGALLVIAVARPSERAQRLRSLAFAGLFLILPLVPYVAFNYSVAGTLFPTTMSAKRAAYEVPLGLGSVAAYLRAAVVVLFFGQVVLLVPGLLWGIWSRLSGARDLAVSRSGDSLARALGLALPAVWAVCLVAVYTVSLPVVFHHGRYLQPLVPIIVVYGIAGSDTMITAMRGYGFKLLARVGILATCAGIVLLWANGARIYADDVKLINDEQVATARWIAASTPPQSIVATHDIGAIGYFSGRRIVDTAGLIDPEAVPLLKDQQGLLNFAREKGATYLAMLPDWYPDLVADPGLRMVFQVQQDYVTRIGVRNMAVYEVSPQ